MIKTKISVRKEKIKNNYLLLKIIKGINKFPKKKKQQ